MRLKSTRFSAFFCFKGRRWIAPPSLAGAVVPCALYLGYKKNHRAFVLGGLFVIGLLDYSIQAMMIPT